MASLEPFASRPELVVNGDVSRKPIRAEDTMQFLRYGF